MKSVLMNLYMKHIKLNPADMTNYIQDLLDELNQLEEEPYPILAKESSSSPK